MAQLAGERRVAAVSRVLRLPSASVSPGAAPSFAAASIAAMLMLATAVALGVLVPAATGQFHYFQPSERPGSLEDLVRPTNEHSGAAVAYFTIDSGFVIGSRPFSWACSC